MQGHSSYKAIRDKARAFEGALPPLQRKALGQYFTGMQVGRVLAHLATGRDTKRILDPMAGTGDLLDAAHESAVAHGCVVERLDGIEIDGATAEMCTRRLRCIANDGGVSTLVIWGDAFDPASHEGLDAGYDLVITNPPYVRYQALKERANRVREGLMTMASLHPSAVARDVWGVLATGYSGLADLSVPAWMLSALLVKPDGRIAVVVPATWRSRAYADVIRYLLLRCFRLEVIIEDTQPGWFSNAMVRTHLVVARRLSDDEAAQPLASRSDWGTALWAQVAPHAGSTHSLVGAAFPGDNPEAAFATWCYADSRPDVVGVFARSLSLETEWRALRARAGGRTWMRTLERVSDNGPLFVQTKQASPPTPDSLADLLPASFNWDSLVSLEDAGISVGQGLRTGCNRFFYVRVVQDSGKGSSIIVTDPALGERVLAVPNSALRPVLHRQSDLDAWQNGILPATRVLDLRNLALPEDIEIIQAAARAYLLDVNGLPEPMPDELAAFVREAADMLLDGPGTVPIAQLSAVRTNVRSARRGSPPRFWYMLPDFKPRHRPQAFVPRIIQRTPNVYANTDPPIVVDANFSTFWTTSTSISAVGLAALLNSAWCRAVMEATGTPLGGGALKLEAVHLRKMPIPALSPELISAVNAVARDGIQNPRIVDRLVLRGLVRNCSEAEVDDFASRLNTRRAVLGEARQRSKA